MQRVSARRLIGALAMALLAPAGAGCGADAVDRPTEAQILSDTCRSMIERSSGRADVVLELEPLEAFLASEPGTDGDRAVAREVRTRCLALARRLRSESGP